MSRHTFKTSVRITCPLSDVYRYFARFALEDDGVNSDEIDERLRQRDDQVQQWATVSVDRPHGRWTFDPLKQIDCESNDAKPFRTISFAFRHDDGVTTVDERLEMDSHGLQNILMWITTPLLNQSLRGEMRTQRNELERDRAESRGTKDA